MMTTTPSHTPTAPRFKAWLIEQKSLIALLVLILVVSFLSPNFFTADNLLNILRQTSVNAIIAVGMTLALGARPGQGFVHEQQRGGKSCGNHHQGEAQQGRARAAVGQDRVRLDPRPLLSRVGAVRHAVQARPHMGAPRGCL